MDTADETRATGDPTSAATALERVVDPVLAVTEEGTITYANAAAEDAFDLSSGEDRPDAASALEPHWEALAGALSETTVGTARRVDLAAGRYDARVHRETTGRRSRSNPPPGARRRRTTASSRSARSTKHRSESPSPIPIARTTRSSTSTTRSRRSRATATTRSSAGTAACYRATPPIPRRSPRCGPPSTPSGPSPSRY